MGWGKKKKKKKKGKGGGVRAACCGGGEREPRAPCSCCCSGIRGTRALSPPILAQGIFDTAPSTTTESFLFFTALNFFLFFLSWLVYLPIQASSIESFCTEYIYCLFVITLLLSTELRPDCQRPNFEFNTNRGRVSVVSVAT